MAVSAMTHCHYCFSLKDVSPSSQTTPKVGSNMAFFHIKSSSDLSLVLMIEDAPTWPTESCVFPTCLLIMAAELPCPPSQAITLVSFHLN